MKSLKVSLIVLFLYLTVVFNIERVSSGTFAELELNGFVNILITVIIISLLLFRFFRNLPGYANLFFWVIAYFVFWFISLNFGTMQASLQVTMIELVFISIAAVLAREVARNFFEVDMTLDRLVLASIGEHTMNLEEASNEIKTELIRSRRYQRSLTVLVVAPDPTSLNKNMMASVEEIRNNLAMRYAMGKISKVINSTARRPDLVMHHANHFILLCPETTTESSKTLVERITKSVKAELDVSVAVGVASFPDDALTFEDLLTKANSKILYLDTPSISSDIENDTLQT
jgi:hypothetical protein